MAGESLPMVERIVPKISRRQTEEMLENGHDTRSFGPVTPTASKRKGDGELWGKSIRDVDSDHIFLQIAQLKNIERVACFAISFSKAQRLQNGPIMDAFVLIRRV